jgi:hypothetical protein
MFWIFPIIFSVLEKYIKSKSRLSKEEWHPWCYPGDMMGYPIMAACGLIFSITLFIWMGKYHLP